eukprot:gene3562-14160_t
MWWRSDRVPFQLVKNGERPIILAPKTRAYFDYYQIEPHSLSQYNPLQGKAPAGMVQRTVSFFNAFSLREYNSSN